MNWALGGTRIFVQKISGGVKNIIAKLQPLAAGTVYQNFGYETNAKKLVGIIVGDTDLQQLQSLTTSGGDSFELTSPEGSLGYFYVETVSEDREPVINQTMRPDLDCDAPVYTVEITLLEDV